jgi:hypothetical protein
MSFVTALRDHFIQQWHEYVEGRKVRGVEIVVGKPGVLPQIRAKSAMQSRRKTLELRSDTF